MTTTHPQVRSTVRGARSAGSWCRDARCASRLTTANLVVIDGSELATAGVRSWCSHLCMTFDHPEAFLRAVVAPSASSVVVIDPATDEGCDLELLHRICSAGHRVLVFSNEHRTDPSLPSVCVSVGAATYVSKTASRHEFMAAVNATRAGERFVSRALKATAPAAETPLSDRERQVLRLWLRMPSKRAVANALHISEPTVNTHICRARKKYVEAGRAAKTKAQIQLRALEDGIVTAFELGLTANRKVEGR